MEIRYNYQLTYQHFDRKSFVGKIGSKTHKIDVSQIRSVDKVSFQQIDSLFI